MTIECMCLVCHGPLPQRANRLTCGVNCAQHWQLQLRQSGGVGDRYLFLRWTHAYRRELLRFQSWITERVDCHGLLLVGGPAA